MVQGRHKKGIKTIQRNTYHMWVAHSQNPLGPQGENVLRLQNGPTVLSHFLLWKG